MYTNKPNQTKQNKKANQINSKKEGRWMEKGKEANRTENKWNENSQEQYLSSPLVWSRQGRDGTGGRRKREN
jgi:hypothetical protein